jgi:hypothetical protein
VIGYTATGNGYTLDDWLFDFGYGRLRLPDAVPWLGIGVLVGSGIFYVWRISALPLPDQRPVKIARAASPKDVRSPSFVVRAIREIAAYAAFLFVFAVVSLPLVVFQRALDRDGLDVLPLETDARGAALVAGLFAVLTALFGFGLGRWAYNEIRVKPTAAEIEASNSVIPKWAEIALSVALAAVILGLIALNAVS